MNNASSSLDKIKSILTKSFSCTNDNIAPFASFVLFTFGGFILFAVYLLPMLHSYLSIPTDEFSYFSLVINLVLTLVLIAMVAMLASFTGYKAKSVFSGKYLRTEEALSMSRERLFPMMRLVFLLGILLYVGFTLYIIPGVIIGVLLFLALPLRNFEKYSVIKSFKFSLQMTFANMAVVLAIIIISGICFSVAMFAGIFVLSISKMYGWIILFAVMGYYLIFSFISYSATYLELTNASQADVEQET